MVRRRAPYHAEVTWRHMVMTIGRLLVALGILILLFVAYLLWGTGISESGHQSALRQQFNQALAQEKGATAGSSTSTTVPSSLVRQLAGGSEPAEGQPVAVLQIPKISLEKVVVQGTATDDLHLGPGHYAHTPLPGQPGNVGIAGHRTTYGAPFYNLNELAPGDKIELTTLQGTFTYVVVRSMVTSPSDNAVLDSSTGPELTLTTCNPRFSASQRLVVQADLTGTPAHAPTGAASTASVAHSAQGLGGAQGNWYWAALWGLAALDFAVTLWLFAHGKRLQWLLYGAGAVPLLVMLFFFFQNVSPLLPASY